MFVYLDAHLLNRPEIMISAAPSRFDANGKLTDETTRKFVAQLVTALRDWTYRLHGRP